MKNKVLGRGEMIKMEMSNFNFQWTKTLYWNILSHITFFCTLFKSLNL